MCDINPSQHLHNNLILLQHFIPATADFVKCFKENMFAKPNRTAFDHTLFYLCNAYDPASYRPKIPWPLLDRNHERTFRQNTVAFIKEILKDVPEARIPPFSPSFISSPGGSRLVKFLWKFSLLVLKTVVQREGEMPVLHYPTAGVHIVKNITVSTIKKLQQEADDFCQFLIDATDCAVELTNRIVNQKAELKSMQSELENLVQGLDNCPLSGLEKSSLLSSDQEQYRNVIKKWQDYINSEAEQTEVMFKDLVSRSSAVTQCYLSVKLFVDNKTMPLVLDASDFPSALKDSNGHLHLAHVLSEGANAAAALFKTLSAFNGFQSLNHVLPTLENMKEHLQNVEKSFAETKAGYIELISESSDSLHSSALEAGSESSPLKGVLRHGYEMLQNAQTCTPPLIFNVDLSAGQRFNAKSPLVEGAIGKSRRPSRSKGPPGANATHTPRGSKCVVTCTPKTSQSFSGLSSRNLTENLPTGKRSKHSKDVPVETANSSLSTILQTPANFCPKQFSTSTVCKPTIATAVDSSKSSIYLPALKVGLVSTAKAPFSNNKVGNTCADPKSVPSFTLCKEGKGEVKKTEETEKDKRTALSKIQLKNEIIEGTYDNISLEEKMVNDLSSQLNGNCVAVRDPVMGPLSPAEISMVKDNFVLKGIRKDFTALQQSKTPSKTSPFRTPSRSPHLLEVNRHKQGGISVIPKINVDALDSTFDSPHSSSVGIFSPPSANNSFFSNDDLNKSTLGMLNEFEDDISPSGRFSLCPPTEIQRPVEESIASEGKVASAEVQTNTRRKSLQAIISRYRDIVAASKTVKPAYISPPTSQVLDCDFEVDLNLEDFNIE